MKRLEVFLLPLDGMLVHRRSLPRNLSGFPQQFAVTHLYTWVERGTVRVKCLTQEHNTMSLARARTRIARSGVKRTNHEATAPPTMQSNGQEKNSIQNLQNHFSFFICGIVSLRFAFSTRSFFIKSRRWKGMAQLNMIFFSEDYYKTCITGLDYDCISMQTRRR